MSARIRWPIAVAAGLTAVVALLPLAFVLPRDVGLTARSAHGTIWSGMLADAAIDGIALGDTHVATRVLPLLGGSVQLDFAAPALTGTLTGTLASAGMAHVTGTVVLDGRLAPLPIAAVVLDDANVRFANGRCVVANGRLQAILAGSFSGLQMPRAMAGTLRCDGDQVAVALQAPSGLDRVDFAVAADGRWRAVLRASANDAGVAARLDAEGSSPGRAGVSFISAERCDLTAGRRRA